MNTHTRGRLVVAVLSIAIITVSAPVLAQTNAHEDNFIIIFERPVSAGVVVKNVHANSLQLLELKRRATSSWAGR